MSVMFILSACNANKTKTQEENNQAQTEQSVPGSDQDEHGCKGSAGYIWSAVRNDCVRPFEAGVKLRDSKNADATSAAFLVFADDSAKVELFLPAAESGIILDKQAEAWKNDTYRVYQKDGKWAVDEKDALIYAE